VDAGSGVVRGVQRGKPPLAAFLRFYEGVPAARRNCLGKKSLRKKVI